MILRTPNLNQKICKPAPKIQSESNDLQTRSKDPIWIKRFANPLQRSNLNQKIRKPAPKIQSESKDSQTRSKDPIWIKRFANPLQRSNLNQKIRKPSPKFQSESKDSQTRSKDPIWIKRFANPLQSSSLNQKIRKPAPKIQSESKDSQTRSKDPIWIKRFANPLQRSDLNQKICKDFRSSDQNQMIHEPAPKFQSESKDLQTCSKDPIWIKKFANPLQRSNLNQKIRKPAPKIQSESKDSQTLSKDPIWIKRFACSKVPIWIKRIAKPLQSSEQIKIICEPSFQIGTSEHISQIFQFVKWFTLWSSDLIQMIRDTRSAWSASKQRIILRCYGSTDLEFQKALFHPSLRAFYKRCRNLKTNGSCELLFFLLENRLSWMIEVTSLNQSEWFERKWLTQLNRFALFTTLSVLAWLSSFVGLKLKSSGKIWCLQIKCSYFHSDDNCFPRRRYPT